MALSLAGCLTLLANIAFAGDVYLPLGGGMEWIYAFQAVTPKGETNEGVLHRKIGEAVTCNGTNYFRLHSWLEDNRPFPMNSTRLVRRDNTGVYSVDERDPRRTEKQIGRLPLEVGKLWTTKLPTGNLQTKVVAKENVKCGGRLYTNCYRVRITVSGTNYQEDFVEAPNVGTVSSEIQRPGGIRWFTTLREFKEPETAKRAP